MARLEGARRIQIVGKFVMLIGCTLAGIFWLGAARTSSPGTVFGFFFITFVPPLLLGGFIWAIGWVVEGFLEPSSRE